MQQNKPIQIALIGNPNSGKSSIFNILTGLKQQVGNFPGVTVEQKTSNISLENHQIHLIDLPGTYSLYPRKDDEKITYSILMNNNINQKIDIVILVADASNLKRNLLFCNQILDLQIPVILVLTMNDIAKKNNIKININELYNELQVPIVLVNARKNKGINDLKNTLATFINTLPNFKKNKKYAVFSEETVHLINQLRILYPHLSEYAALQHLMNAAILPISKEMRSDIEHILINNPIQPIKIQAEEILQRYKYINQIIKKTVTEPNDKYKKIMSEKLDNIFLNRVYGYAILLFVFFLLFQSIFWLAKFPMGWIELFFQQLSIYISHILANNWFKDLIVNGLIAGLSGICVFIPQIMLLFGLTTILEDTGYMARISFLMDKILRKVGLNGKSIMPMISGFACAVPAILSSRNIENKKERLLTILITPFMSCSARIPVYTILIALMVNEKIYLGFLSLQGLIMMFFYLFGILIALLVSFILSKFIKNNEKSFFILELPTYRIPRWKNVFLTMFQKATIFVKDAGKIIIIISLLLWFLNSFGPKKQMDELQNKYAVLYKTSPLLKDSLQKQYYAQKLEISFAGLIGKKIEPIIKPLGFDWKIGIALITSFAAREVFVGTMATLYSIESEENTSSLRNKMKLAVNDKGNPVYSIATTASLLIFYALAMQCMSTMVMVYKELKSLKWTIIQFFIMTGLAYFCSFVIYQLLH